MDSNTNQSFKNNKEPPKTSKGSLPSTSKNDPKTSKSQILVKKPYEVKRSPSSESPSKE